MSAARHEAFAESVRAWPVIPAVRDPAHLDRSIAAPGRVVYLLCGTILTIESLARALVRAGKLPVVNVDLLAGVGKDKSAMTWLGRSGVHGIISTHAETLRAARANELVIVQRSFLLDSQARDHALRTLGRFAPDAIELLPAPAVPRVVTEFALAAPTVPLIAGGLVASLREIDDLVRAGVDAVSVGNPSLWMTENSELHLPR